MVSEINIFFKNLLVIPPLPLPNTEIILQIILYVHCNAELFV